MSISHTLRILREDLGVLKRLSAPFDLRHNVVRRIAIDHEMLMIIRLARRISFPACRQYVSSFLSVALFVSASVLAFLSFHRDVGFLDHVDSPQSTKFSLLEQYIR